MKKMRILASFLVVSSISLPVLADEGILASAAAPATAPAAGEALPGAQEPMGSSTPGYSPEVREYSLKAAFLRYVAKFVEWPQNALPEGMINICILGLVPSYEALNSINGKVVNDRTLALFKISDISEAKSRRCQILFVTKTELDNISKIITALQNSPILGFGDMENYAAKGGDMNFYIANNHLAIMINPPAVEKSQLKINPRMMKLVTVVPSASQTNFAD